MSFKIQMPEEKFVWQDVFTYKKKSTKEAWVAELVFDVAWCLVITSFIVFTALHTFK